MVQRTRECSIQDLPKKVATEIQRYTSPDERVITVFETELERGEKGLLFRDPSFTEDYYAQVLTHDQLIIYWRSVGRYSNNESCESWRLIDLKDNFSIFGNAPDYRVIAGGAMCFFVSEKSARKFLEIIRPAIAQAKARTSAVAPRSTLSVQERLRVLNQLHKDGFITDAEFEQKRKEILNQI